ncbi:MAG: SPOR domain-containing protein [Flavobacteriia bacterium]|nr:SPOR domain-containing protein [Flavobacteriia bacterium]
MDKYLQQILHEVNTIIIPDLGALTVTKKDTMELLFMPFLKHDDGNLSKIIAQKENISENDAKNLIAKYVRDVQNQLDKGESYDMYLFGKFYKINGEVKFQNWKEYNKNTSTDKDENFVIIPDEKKEEINETTSANTPLTNLDSLLENSEKEEKDFKDEVENKENSTPEIILNPVEDFTEKIQQKSEIQEGKENVIPQVIPSPKEENLIFEKSSNKAKNKTEEEIEKDLSKNSDIPEEYKIRIKKKKSAGFYLLLFLILFLIAGSSTIYIFKEPLLIWWEDKKQSVDSLAQNERNIISEKELDSLENQVSQLNNNINNEIDENQEDVENDVKEDINKQEKVTVKENVSETKTPSSNTEYRNKFHLIVGGFLSEDNAKRFADKLHKENGKALLLGQFDDKYLVSYNYFNSKEEAVSFMKTMELSSWVFFY